LPARFPRFRLAISYFKRREDASVTRLTRAMRIAMNALAIRSVEPSLMRVDRLIHIERIYDSLNRT
jgi:hypothetical protein